MEQTSKRVKFNLGFEIYIEGTEATPGRRSYYGDVEKASKPTARNPNASYGKHLLLPILTTDVQYGKHGRKRKASVGVFHKGELAVIENVELPAANLQRTELKDCQVVSACAARAILDRSNSKRSDGYKNFVALHNPNIRLHLKAMHPDAIMTPSPEAALKQVWEILMRWWKEEQAKMPPARRDPVTKRVIYGLRMKNNTGTLGEVDANLVPPDGDEGEQDGVVLVPARGGAGGGEEEDEEEEEEDDEEEQDVDRVLFAPSPVEEEDEDEQDDEEEQDVDQVLFAPAPAPGDADEEEEKEDEDDEEVPPHPNLQARISELEPQALSREPRGRSARARHRPPRRASRRRETPPRGQALRAARLGGSANKCFSSSQALPRREALPRAASASSRTARQRHRHRPPSTLPRRASRRREALLRREALPRAASASASSRKARQRHRPPSTLPRRASRRREALPRRHTLRAARLDVSATRYFSSSQALRCVPRRRVRCRRLVCAGAYNQ